MTEQKFDMPNGFYNIFTNAAHTRIFLCNSKAKFEYEMDINKFTLIEKLPTNCMQLSGQLGVYLEGAIIRYKPEKKSEALH